MSLKIPNKFNEFHIYRCVAVETNLITANNFTCLFYQTHPGVHTGLQTDIVKDTLPANVIRSCSFGYLWPFNQGIFRVQVNLGMMPRIYQMLDSGLPTPSPVKHKQFFYRNRNTTY